MTRREIFSDFLYEFKAPPEITNLGINILRDVEWVPNVNNYRCYSEYFERDGAKDLKKWFNFCLESVRKDLNLTCENLEVCQVWGNKATNSQWHHAHKHQNSWASGILYLTESNSCTWFSKQHMWQQNETLSLMQEETLTVLFKYPTSPGTLIIFPSNLLHSVDEHYGAIPRLTISFNSFPSGFITGRPETKNSATELNIKIL